MISYLLDFYVGKKWVKLEINPVTSSLFRWLWNGSHNVVKADRPVLIKLFRKMVYSKSVQDYEEAEAEFFENEICNKYPRFMSHINNSYISRKEKWAMHVRNMLKLPTHAVNTSNFVESSFRILKEFVFNRTKVMQMSRFEMEIKNVSRTVLICLFVFYLDIQSCRTYKI